MILDNRQLNHRLFVIRLATGEYYTRSHVTGWDTMKESDVFATDRNSATVFTFVELLKVHHKLIIGYAGTTVERVL